MKRVSMIVATDKNRGIGKTTLGVGKLLWNIPEDLRRFKELTIGHPVIMGRKTFESVLSYLKKPFPGRTNIVITHRPQLSSSRKRGSDSNRILNPSFARLPYGTWLRKGKQVENDIGSVGDDNVIIVHSLGEALEEAKKSPGNEEVFIAGGGQIFEQGLPFADRIYLTLVEGEYGADTFFPDYSDFKKVVSKENRETADGLKFTWLTLEK